VPIVPFDTVTSSIAGPRIPFGARWMCASVAGERNPEKFPLIANFLPVRTAVADPRPATRDIMVVSIGTGVRRALNVSPRCATTAPADAKIIAPNKNASRQSLFSLDIPISKSFAPSAYRRYRKRTNRTRLVSSIQAVRTGMWVLAHRPLSTLLCSSVQENLIANDNVPPAD
jgi:hypothetical protein